MKQPQPSSKVGIAIGTEYLIHINTDKQVVFERFKPPEFTAVFAGYLDQEGYLRVAGLYIDTYGRDKLPDDISRSASEFIVRNFGKYINKHINHIDIHSKKPDNTLDLPF